MASILVCFTNVVFVYPNLIPGTSANDALQQISLGYVILKTEEYLKILDTDSRLKKRIHPQEWDNAIFPNMTSSIAGVSAEQREDLKKAHSKRPIDQLDNDPEDDNDGTNAVAS